MTSDNGESPPMTRIGEPAAVEKYAPGKNPNSLANLRPPFPKGISQSPGHSVGPMFTPAVRRMAQYSYEYLRDIDLGPLNVMDAIAVVTLVKAVDARYGDKTRELLAARLDGDKSDAPPLNVQVGIMLRWDDGKEA